MIICICANISQKAIQQEPNLLNVVGLGCGKCLEHASNKNIKHHNTTQKLLEPKSDEIRRPK